MRNIILITSIIINIGFLSVIIPFLHSPRVHHKQWEESLSSLIHKHNDSYYYSLDILKKEYRRQQWFNSKYIEKEGSPIHILEEVQNTTQETLRRLKKEKENISWIDEKYLKYDDYSLNYIFQTNQKLDSLENIIQKKIELNPADRIEINMSGITNQIKDGNKESKNTGIDYLYKYFTIKRNLIYTNVLQSIKNNNKTTPFNLKPIFYTKEPFYNLGDSIKFNYAIAKVYTKTPPKSYAVIGNDTFQFNKNGIIYYSTKPTKKGKNELDISISLHNNLAGESFSTLSSLEYYVE